MANKSARQLLLALLVFATTQVVLIVLLMAIGFDQFHSLNWLRYDSGHYLYIAETGYEFFPCAGKFGYAEDSPDFCGNTGWMPGYPLLLRVISLFSNDLVLWGGIISKVFYFLSIFMLFKLCALSEFSFRNYLIGCIGAFWFGSIYYNAIFPISATVLLIVAALYFILDRKILPAACMCFLASFFYATGFLLSAVIAIHIMLRSDQIMARIRDSALIIFLGAAGLAAAFYVMYLDTGVWDGFIKVQSKYGHGLHDPIRSFWDKMKMIDIKEVASFKYYQSIAVILTLLLFSLFFFRRERYRNALDQLTWIFAVIFIGFPWIIGGDLSIYRSEALLFPIAVVFKEVPVKWLVFMLIILLIIGIPMAYLYFVQALV